MAVICLCSWAVDQHRGLRTGHPINIYWHQSQVSPHLLLILYSFPIRYPVRSSLWIIKTLHADKHLWIPASGQKIRYLLPVKSYFNEETTGSMQPNLSSEASQKTDKVWQQGYRKNFSLKSYLTNEMLSISGTSSMTHIKHCPFMQWLRQEIHPSGRICLFLVTKFLIRSYSLFPF